MALRFLGGHCVSNSIIQTLRDANHEVLRVKDLLPSRGVSGRGRDCQSEGSRRDPRILEWDFADIVTHPPREYEGIVALQVRNHPEVIPHLMARLTAYLGAQPAIEHYRGKLLVVEADRIRIRE